MLSLSIFSSSQRISVALYEEQKLKEFIETKIKSNKIDPIFLLLKKILVGKGRKISKKIESFCLPLIIFSKNFFSNFPS